MQARDIDSHFRTVGPFVKWDRQVDAFKIGHPNRAITTVAVVWKPTFAALREAHARGAQLVVAHESVFVQGGSGREDDKALPSEQEKADWLRDAGLVVYRCHDLWDRFPDIGIRASWQRSLQLQGRIVQDRFPLLVTEIEPIPLSRLVDKVLTAIRPLGQTAVSVIGNLEQPVSRVATGTGVTTDPMAMWELGADAGIMTDDYFLYVREGAHAAERGFPLIVVNHGVAEEWGIAELAGYLARTFPRLTVFHIPQSCPFVVIGHPVPCP